MEKSNNKDTTSTIKTSFAPKKPKIGALWARESKTNGEEYFSGEITVNDKKISFVAYRNDYKEQENHPDFKIYERPQIENQVAEVKKTAATLKTSLKTPHENTTEIQVEYPAGL